jgi:uncharacterized membrane protein
MEPAHEERDTQSSSRTLDENVRVIKNWEQSALHARSRAERVSEWITSTAGRGHVLLAHVVWFACWAAINLDLVPGVRPFDVFPFPLLTTMVSLEAIFLALFVLSSQNRLAMQADKRAHLDLQINLLAEREMTAVLQLLRDIAARLGVEHPVDAPRIQELAKETDVHELTSKLDAELPATESPDGAEGSARSSS